MTTTRVGVPSKRTRHRVDLVAAAAPPEADGAGDVLRPSDSVEGALSVVQLVVWGARGVCEKV